MSNDNSFLDLDLESDFEDYNPLDEVEPEEDDEDYVGIEGYLGEEHAVEEPVVPQIPAAERIQNLFKSMAPRRKTLLGILAFVETPQSTTALEAKVDELQAHNFSVYSSGNLSALLEQAGAITRVTEEGEPYENIQNEPEIVEIDGVEYLQPVDPPEIYWVITADGADYLASDRPLDRLRDILEQDTIYLPIYERILTMCEDGKTVKEINAQVDDDPLVQKPRLYAPHFIDKLEKCDALEWADSWKTTEIGREGLAMVQEMMAAQEDETAEADASEGVEA